MFNLQPGRPIEFILSYVTKTSSSPSLEQLQANKIRTPTFHKIRTPTFKIEKFMGGMFFSASQAISQKGEFFDKKTSN